MSEVRSSPMSLVEGATFPERDNLSEAIAGGVVSLEVELEGLERVIAGPHANDEVRALSSQVALNRFEEIVGLHQSGALESQVGEDGHIRYLTAKGSVLRMNPGDNQGGAGMYGSDLVAEYSSRKERSNHPKRGDEFKAWT